jgi:hypothetical protein
VEKSNNTNTTGTDGEGLLDGRRRSVLKGAATGLSLAVLGGSAVGTAGAAHDSDVCQVDLVATSPSNLKDPLDEDGGAGNFYSDDADLVRWVWADGSTDSTAEENLTPYDGGLFNGATVTTQSGINIDFTTDTASVEFTVSGGTTDLSLVSYSTGSGASLGWDPSGASDQRIHDIDHDTFDNDGSLTVALPSSSNAVTNHDLESGTLGEPGSPTDWATSSVFTGSATHSYVETESRTGSRSIKIESGSGGDTNWFNAGLPVDPNKSYIAGGWIKTNNLQSQGSRVQGVIGADTGGGVGPQTESLTGTNDWTYKRVPFKPDGTDTNIKGYLGANGDASGTVYFDDLQIKELPGNISTFGREVYYAFDTDGAMPNQVTGTPVNLNESGSAINKADSGRRIKNTSWNFGKDDNDSAVENAASSGTQLPLNGEEATLGFWLYHTGNDPFGTMFTVGAGIDAGRPGNDGYWIEENGGYLLNNAGVRVSRQLDKWVFIVVVLDGDDVALYEFDLNGLIETATGTYSARNRTGNETLTLGTGDTGREFSANYDELHGYSRALTETEVWRLYQGTLDGASPTPT